MKKIIINDQEFEFSTFIDCSEYGTSEWTEFYKGTEIKTYKKFFIFGPEINVVVPKKIFEVNLNIEDPSYSKFKIREKINQQVELLNRKEEIERGEII